MDPDSVAAACKALGHPARVRIVKLLAAQTECRGADVFGELPLAQSTISEHLRVLKEAGVVQSRTVGTGAVYCLAPGVLQELGAELSGIVSVCSPCEWAR